MCCLARPRHRPRAPQPGPPLPPAPFTPVGPCLVRRLEAQLWLSISNFARNSPSTSSNIEFIALELQCFWGVSKNDRDKLRATFGGRWCRLPRAPQPGPLAPSGALHTCGVWCGDMRFGASARCPARLRHSPRASQPGPPVRSMCVVTNVVNRRCFSCGFVFRCYKRRQSDGFLAENSGFLA